MATSFMVVVVLIAILAVVLIQHLQLLHKYNELKSSCLEGRLDIHEKSLRRESKDIFIHQKRNTRNDESKFFMHSSTKAKGKGEKIQLSLEKERYLEDYEPTSFGGESWMSMAVLSSSTLINNLPFKTLTSVFENRESKTDLIEKNVPHRSTMISTNKNQLVPSQSTSLLLTQKDTLSVHSDIDKGISNETLSMITNSKPLIFSSTIEIESSVQAQKDEDSVNSLKYHTNTDADSSRHKNLELYLSTQGPFVSEKESMLDDSTKEKEIFVLKTSLQEENNHENWNDQNIYWDTQDSTPVLDSERFSKTLDLMTDTTQFLEDIDEGSCGSFECVMGQDYEDRSFIPDENEQNEKYFYAEESVISMDENFRNEMLSEGTSAWCDSKFQATCKFKNLCYNTQERDFVFFVGENSVMDLGESQKEDRVFSINLSTIKGHNTQLFSVTTLKTEDIRLFTTVGVVLKSAVAFNRFKPDNVMHVLHDDILPLLHTMNRLKFPLRDGKYDRVIVFTDVYDELSYAEFYSSLSHFHPLMLQKFNQTYELMCFSELFVGLQSGTVWYQYGFFKPQGPVVPQNEQVLTNVRRGTKFLSTHFQSECFLCKNGNYLVFLSRKENRLILNEGELIMSLTKSTRLKVMSVSLETHSVSEIITIIQQSKGVFGMHGSLLALAVLFLPPGSVLIELFPYAINPSKYTPFKSFCDLAGSGILYKAWANPSQENSVPHPERPTKEGGLFHLPEDAQKYIATQLEVPEHLCCEDPSWLYHIYQDTYVDVKSVVSLINESLDESKQLLISNSELYYDSISKNVLDLPGSVRQLQCDKVNSVSAESKGALFRVSWLAPWKFQYDATTSHGYQYELVIQEDNSKDSVRLLLPPDQLLYDYSSNYVKTDHVSNMINFWVSVVSRKGVKSHSKFVRCVSRN